MTAKPAQPANTMSPPSSSSSEESSLRRRTPFQPDKIVNPLTRRLLRDVSGRSLKKEHNRSPSCSSSSEESSPRRRTLFLPDRVVNPSARRLVRDVSGGPSKDHQSRPPAAASPSQPAKQRGPAARRARQSEANKPPPPRQPATFPVHLPLPTRDDPRPRAPPTNADCPGAPPTLRRAPSKRPSSNDDCPRPPPLPGRSLSNSLSQTANPSQSAKHCGPHRTSSPAFQHPASSSPATGIQHPATGFQLLDQPGRTTQALSQATETTGPAQIPQYPFPTGCHSAACRPSPCYCCSPRRLSSRTPVVGKGEGSFL